MEKRFVGSDELKDLCLEFCELVKDQEIDVLVIVTKGWLVPWYYIARELGIKDIRTICVSSYERNESKELAEHYFPNIPIDKKVLVFDELSDGWKTLTYVQSKIHEHANTIFGTLFKAKGSSFTPNYWVIDKEDDLRIDFYYEH